MLYCKSSLSFVAVLLPLGTLLLVAEVAKAVDFGWQELPGGGIEYLVQVEPSLVDSFRQGGFASDIPPGLRDVRRIRIVVGEKELPNQNNLDGPKVTRAAETQSTVSKISDDPNRKIDHGSPDDSRNGGAQAIEATAPSSTFNTAESGSQPAKSKTPPAMLDPSNLMSAIPFFQPGRTRSTTTTNPALPPPDTGTLANRSATEPGAISTGWPNDKIEPPVWKEDSRPRAGNDPAASYLAVNAAKPDSSTPETVPSAPNAWLPLMLALLALFLSLGANVYLVWIHQGVRAKYLALAERRGGDVATAM